MIYMDGDGDTMDMDTVSLDIAAYYSTFYIYFNFMTHTSYIIYYSIFNSFIYLGLFFAKNVFI